MDTTLATGTLHDARVRADQAAGRACELSVLLQYRNKDVIDSFCASLDIAEAEAELIFVELLKFFWISETSKEHSVRTIDTPILILDEMWHTFVLFTREYAGFCDRYFGRFIHHVPTTETQKLLERERSKDHGRRAQVMDEKRERYNLIYDLLGKETFQLWYFKFPDLYSSEKIRNLRCK